MNSRSPSKTGSQANGAGAKRAPKEPSPKKSPVKASSKLALMKKRADEEEEEERRNSEKEEKKSKLVISPKKEPIARVSSEAAATPKTGVSAGSAKRVSTPKSGGGSNKTSPTKPEVRKYPRKKRHPVHSFSYYSYNLALKRYVYRFSDKFISLNCFFVFFNNTPHWSF